MGRQQTLGKFFGKTGDPPVQTTLDDASSAKRKRAVQPDTKADKRADDEKAEEQGESKRSPSPVKEKAPASKRRRVIESDDEDAPEPGPSTAKKSQPSAPKPRSSKAVPHMSAVPPRRKPRLRNLPPKMNQWTRTRLPLPQAMRMTQMKGKRKSMQMRIWRKKRARLLRMPKQPCPAHKMSISPEVGRLEIRACLNTPLASCRFTPTCRVPYAALAKVFSLIEATTKRIEKTSLLTSFLLLVIRRRAKGDTQSLLQAVYLCINRLCPDYVGIELGIGESLLIKAISESTGRSMATVKADLKKEGDLGLVAMNSKNSQKTLFKPKPLTLPVVFKNLKEIALSSGHSSQNKKVSIITKLLASCQGQEAKYIVRSLEGKLRIGNAERTVLVALAHATVLAEQESFSANKRLGKDKLTARLEEAASIIKQVYSELPNYDLVIPALLNVGIDKLREECKLTPGVPLKPMLAKPTKAIGEVLDKFEGKKFTCEYKYDGERAQVHKLEDGTIAVFSRNSEDMSKKYPDLMEQLPRCVKEGTKTFVFDAEAVAIDKDSAKLLPFQELSRRKRKDVKVEDIKVRVCLFAFDLLYLNGEPLLQKELSERRELLKQHFQPVELEFQFAKASDAHETDEIQTFLEESVKDGCEGLMVKMLEGELSHYEPSRRTVNWLKLKKDYLAGLGDSLDLVVVGGYYGKGKRTNVYGAFLLACYDSDSEEYQTICKIGTGFSDEALQAHYESLKPLEMQTPRGDIKVGGAKPDVWFEPKIVWEVLTADLSLSPIYTAAQGLAEERGISLRFPRFIKVRDDKSADDATGPEQIAEMYQRQVLAQTKGGKKGRGGDADDGFW
ncbi:ATP-dependent DNA ligase [Cerioporus squamosus]|nr:ATP-dependent DNA ligase [Cerioporus squamosus]